MPRAAKAAEPTAIDHIELLPGDERASSLTLEAPLVTALVTSAREP